MMARASSPCNNDDTDTSKKPRLDISPYDKTLDHLFQQHSNEPFSLLKTIFSSAKWNACSAIEENRTSKKTQVAEESKCAQAADESKQAPKEEPKKDQLPENKTSTDESSNKAAVEKAEIRSWEEEGKSKKRIADRKEPAKSVVNAGGRARRSLGKQPSHGVLVAWQLRDRRVSGVMKDIPSEHTWTKVSAASSEL